MKNIVEIIKKMALGNDPDDPPKRETPRAPSNDGFKTKIEKDIEREYDKPRQQPKSTIRPGYGLAAVKEMQQAILNFAEVAASTDVTSMTGNQQGQQYGQQTRAIPGQPVAGQGESKDDKEYLGGSDPFGNFLVQHYVKGDPAGQQYLNVDVSGNKARSDAAIENLNIRGILDSIKRIGSPGMSEKTVDGIWQVRTNNALKNIFALTNGMLKFTQAMKLQVPGYTEETLKTFESMIPKSYTDLKTPNAIAESAKQITDHIKAITNFFTNLKAAVFNKPELRKFIDQKEAFVSYKKKNEVEIPQGIKDKKLPNVKFNWITDPSQNHITLRELSSLDEFKKFVIRSGTGQYDPDKISTDILKEILHRTFAIIDNVSGASLTK